VKPHGSLSWEDGGDSDHMKWRNEHGEPLLEAMPAERVHPPSGAFMQPLVLGAVPMKERLIKETQRANPAVYEIFADQWAAAVDAIMGATSLSATVFHQKTATAGFCCGRRHDAAVDHCLPSRTMH